MFAIDVGLTENIIKDSKDQGNKNIIRVCTVDVLKQKIKSVEYYVEPEFLIYGVDI